MAPRDRERAQRLMEKGNQELEGGNLSAARLFYEYEADVGLADAARYWPPLFDGSELAKLNVRGIAPNAKEAQRWYERAWHLTSAQRKPISGCGGSAGREVIDRDADGPELAKVERAAEALGR